MKKIQVLSSSEQVAAELKKSIIAGDLRGVTQGVVPGVIRLSKMLGVNAKTVVSALVILEKEGLLINQGPRRKRLVNEAWVTSKRERQLGQIRLGILLYEPADRSDPLTIELFHALSDSGHTVRYADKTLTELRMNLSNVEKLVKKESFDAWLVVAGSREVLEWFSQQSTPVFALFGRRASLRIPSVGPRSNEAFIEGVEQLIALGHRRIVKICRSERRLPRPGLAERLFFEKLAENKIQVGDYNLPPWEETIVGFQDLLASLFQVTPPTALIFDEPSYLVAALQFLGEKGLRVPSDVSLICLSSDPNFEWCCPSIACVRWEIEPVIRRVMKWASNVANGKDDFTQTNTPAVFRMGGTVGPVLNPSSD